MEARIASHFALSAAAAQIICGHPNNVQITLGVCREALLQK
jgi:hypothetical protein